MTRIDALIRQLVSLQDDLKRERDEREFTVAQVCGYRNKLETENERLETRNAQLEAEVCLLRQVARKVAVA